VAIELETGKPGHAAAVDARDVAWFEWVNDERLVFTVYDRQIGGGVQRGSGMYTVKRDGTDLRSLLRPAMGARTSMRSAPRFLAALDDGSDNILVLANEARAIYPDVYLMSTETGAMALRSLGKPADIVRWVADRKGALRAAVADAKEKGTQVYWRASESAPWEVIAEHRLRGASVVPLAFDGDGSLIVAANIGRDTLALYRFDTERKRLGELLLAHADVDLGGDLVYDRRQQRVVGARFHAGKPGVAWFDGEWAKLAASVDRTLPDHFNALSRGAGPRVLIHSYSDTDPGSYWVYDTDKRQMERLAVVRKGIDPAAMPARTPLRYAARDGLPIPAWLTLPKGRDPKKLPLVVLVHGGPWVRGSGWAWDPAAAYLAALGYAVLEPDYRGSLGWGYRHFAASFKQWGRAMQDDLDDGVDWLVQQGTVDPTRVCIMGGSYGGYAVMMGLARDPQRWRCGVNYVGVDINLMYDVTWSDSINSTFIKHTARDMIGDPVADAAQLKATSPIEQAARIKAPVLMAYGANDRRVPLVHGQQMRDALAAANVPVEWVVYADEGHGFLVEANRFDFYRRVARFLERNLRAAE
jgi:dipeptidyl aminopeptidase/acylaminoacyl peptidase